jgi:hypothetical protein
MIHQRAQEHAAAIVWVVARATSREEVHKEARKWIMRYQAVAAR